MMYLAKTFQPSPSVLFLSTLGPRSGVNLHLTPFLCLNQVDSALEEAQAGVSAPGGESTTQLCHLLLLQIFTHPMCNQLDVRPLDIMCVMDSPPQGTDLLHDTLL